MASGDTLIVWTPQASEAPNTAFATLNLRNQHPVLQFISPGTPENSRFSGVMPQHYAGTTGVTLYLHYSMASAIGDDIKIETSFERIGDQQQDLDSDSFASAQNTGDITVPGTSGLVDIITTTHTDGGQMDSVAVGEGFRINLKRVAVAGTDAAGDLEIRFVELRET